jgi:hypothetical protein
MQATAFLPITAATYEHHVYEPFRRDAKKYSKRQSLWIALDFMLRLAWMELDNTFSK